MQILRCIHSFKYSKLLFGTMNATPDRIIDSDVYGFDILNIEIFFLAHIVASFGNYYLAMYLLLRASCNHTQLQN